MVYSTDADFAQYHDYANWAAYAAANPVITQTTLGIIRGQATTKLNKWIGCGITDIDDTTYTTYLKWLEVEVILRINDKRKMRKSSKESQIFQPHDYLYKDERNELMSIGVKTGNRRVGLSG